MARGIEGRDIFSSNNDRTKFLSLLSSGLKRTGYACYAWALMRNHYHLVLRSSELHLAELMRQLNAAYAQYFSKAYHRHGYLFQDRYKSLVTQDQGYVEELIRYVHANPLRSGLCKSLEDLAGHPWTGHAVLMGTRTADFQDTWPVLRRFGPTIEAGRKGYAEFMAKAALSGDEAAELLSSIRKGNTDREKRNPGAYVIGDPEFVRQVLAKDHAQKAHISRHALENLAIDDVATKIAKAAGIAKHELWWRGRANRRSALRKIFAYICYRMYGFTIAEVARYLDCTHSPMSLAARQGQELAGKKEFTNILIALRP
jgi:REP element-mobilizing transposase RayT